MPISKIKEFAKNGQKSTEGIILENGFPIEEKPARQWFNYLFNSSARKTNEIIDVVDLNTNNISTLTTDLEEAKLDTGITTVPQYAGSVVQTLYDINADNTTAKTFGAKCDGVTDDTIALQKYLNTNIKNIVIPDTCLISNTLVSQENDRTIKTTGTGIICKTEDKIVLRINGNNNKVTVDINGYSKACVGVLVFGDNCKVTGCNIINLYGVTQAVWGISINEDVTATVTGNTIDNVDALDNTTTGDGIGACRGVHIASTIPRTKTVIVSGNTLSNILGQEGDAIQIIANTGTLPFAKANALISGNTIINCTRRAIKIQASNVQCIGNTHVNHLPASRLIYAATLIDNISGNNVTIIGNTVDARVAFGGINANGTEDGLISGNVVSDNIVISADTESTGSAATKVAMYVNYCKNMVLQGNTVKGGTTGIAVDRSENIIVNNNKLSGGDGGNGINVVSNSKNCDISDNTLIYGNRSFLVTNGSLNSRVKGNTVLSGTADCVRLLPSALKSVYENNTNMGTGISIFFSTGDSANQFVFNHRSVAAGSVSPSIMFTKQIPSLEQPNCRHNDGDISFKADGASGTNTGWQCVSGGTPGIWKEFGTTAP